jgi:hypothetical protein
MSDDAIYDMIFAVSCNHDESFCDMFDDVKGADWEYDFGSVDVISCEAQDAEGRVFVELYPCAFIYASQSETGVIEFNEDGHPQKPLAFGALI